MNNPFTLREVAELEPVNHQLEIAPGVYYDLSNEQYHVGPGISKSGLDLIDKSPSIFKWNQNAPRHEEKLAALDLGTALHCMLLEPDEFNSRFVGAPEVNRRTIAGREKEQAFFDECKSEGFTVITHEEREKLNFMRDSVMAHPVGRYIFDQDGTNEASIYWTDQETGELCRVRPDRFIEVNGRPVIVDVKKIDGIDRFKRHVFDFRYHVQAAMYRRGFEAQFGVLPDFWFLVVSSTVSAGRYEVDVIQLPADVLNEGEERYRSNLNLYHQCKQANDWLHISTLK